MLFQLGNKEFEGLFAPASWNYAGNDANYAQHALINGKPRLQLTGQMLEELNLSIKLRVEYCNPTNEIQGLKDWKSNGEVLPLLLGNGEYKNDYVISSMTYTIDQTFADGTIIEANCNINLLEYIPYSKEEQQAQADRKKALAVGDKKQLTKRPAQKPTSEAEAHATLMAAQNETWQANEAAAAALQTGSPSDFVSQVRAKIQTAQNKMNEARTKIQGVQNTVTGAVGIITATEQSIAKLGEISAFMTPPINLQSLNNTILNSQVALRLVGTSSTTFSQNIILRRF